MRVASLLMAALLALVCVPMRATAAESTATLVARVQVFQEYKVPMSGLQNSFEYVVAPVEGDAPLPVDADGKAFDRFVLRREDSLWLEFPVRVSVDDSAAPYAYHYVLSPAQRVLEDGLHYVDALSTSLAEGANEYLLELYVQPSNDDAAASRVTPLVHVDAWDGPKVADPGWRVGYTAPVDEEPGGPGRQDPDETKVIIDGEQGGGSWDTPVSDVIKPTDEGEAGDEEKPEDVQDADPSEGEDEQSTDKPSDDDGANPHETPGASEGEEGDAAGSDAGDDGRTGRGGSTGESNGSESGASASRQASGGSDSSASSVSGSGVSPATQVADRSFLARTGDESRFRPVATAVAGFVLLIGAVRSRRGRRAGEQNA